MQIPFTLYVCDAVFCSLEISCLEMLCMLEASLRKVTCGIERGNAVDVSQNVCYSTYTTMDSDFV